MATAEEDVIISKSEAKRQVQALDQLAKQLTELNTAQRKKLDLDADLQGALEEYDRIASHEAKRRQLRRIAKLVRQRDTEQLAEQMALYDASSEAHARFFQQIEHWRDRLLAEDTALAEYIDTYPQADRQQLAQLVRNARKEASLNKPPAQTRKLFKLLRSTAEAHLE